MGMRMKDLWEETGMQFSSTGRIVTGWCGQVTWCGWRTANYQSKRAAAATKRPGRRKTNHKVIIKTGSLRQKGTEKGGGRSKVE